MAEELEGGAAVAEQAEGGEAAPEAQSEAAPADPAEAAAPVESPGPSALLKGWSALMVALAFVAVGMTLLGVLSQASETPRIFPLAAGLLAWGVLDLIGQGRGLFKWKGAAAALGNTLNLVRAGALLALGAFLLAQTLGALKPSSTSTLSMIAVAGVGGYLLAAFALEIFVQGAVFTAQAALLGALGFQIASYLYFTLPFTYGWAAVLALGSFACALWAAWKGSLEQSPALGRAVLVATLLLGLPFLTFTFEQMFGAVMQPAFPPVLLVKRMHQMAGDLKPGAGSPSWAPRHTKPDQPGDIPYSDKMAFLEPDPGGNTVSVYLQREVEGELARSGVGEGALPGAWSNDGVHYAFTDLKGSRRRLRLLSSAGPEGGWTLSTVNESDPEPGPDHGQVWLGASEHIYFSAPQSDLRKRPASVYRASPKTKALAQVGPNGRIWPAVAPDGKALLTVGFSPNIRYLEIADPGSKARKFKLEAEQRFFPAWSSTQTRVLFVKDGVLMTMKSNGTQAEPFDADSNLDSKDWLSESKEPFTLQWRETGDHWQVWRSEPDGSRQKKIFEDVADVILPPRWSPDSSKVALALMNGGEATVMTFKADGSWPRKSFSAKGALRELKWSPDSLRLGFILERPKGKGQEAWTAGDDGLDPQRIFASKGQLSCLSWSPASKHIAFEERHAWKFLGLRLVRPDLFDVHMVDLAEKQARVMTRYGIMAAQPVFSPQGVSLAYFTDQERWAPGLFRRRTRSLVSTQLY